MDTLSNKSKLVVASVLATALAGGPLLAQSYQGEQSEKRDHEKTKLHIVGHDAIIGAPVINEHEGTSGKKLGTISDLVLDARKGRVLYAVLDSDSTTGADRRRTPIHWKSLEYNAKKSMFTLAMTSNAVKRLPEFDSKTLQRLGRDVSATDATKQRKGDVGRDAAKWTRPSLVLVSKIAGCAVLADKDKLGSGDTLFLEPKSGCAAFLTVQTAPPPQGKTDYVVPWAALRFVEAKGKQPMQLQLGRPKGALKAAPKLGDEHADVNKAEFRKKVYEFYGVERPAYEQTESKKGKEHERLRRLPKKRH